MRICETTKLQPGSTVRVHEVSGNGGSYLRGKTATVVAPYSGAPADNTPVAGVSGHGFGSNLYPDDVIEVVAP